jgi:alpha-1,6-mannosyltransferase
VLLAATAVGTALLLLAKPDAQPDTTFPLVVAALVPFVALTIREYRDPTLPLWLVLSTGGVLATLAVVRPPLGSHDLWSYAMYGRTLAVHHASPYLHRPSEYVNDPALRRVASGWRDTKSVYGPGFTLVSAGLAKLGGTSPLVTRLAFQGLAAGAFATCVALLVRAGTRGGALIAVALNPLVIVTVLNGGHNDLLIGLAILAATLMLRDRRWVAVGVFLAVAVMVKIVALLPAAAAFLWVGRHYGRGAAAKLAAAVAIPTLSGYALFGGFAALGPLAQASGRTSRVSPWRLVGYIGRASDLRDAVPVSAAAIATGMVCVTVALVAVRFQRTAAPPLMLASLAGYLFAAGWILPWYLAWALPVAALDASSRLSRAIALYSVAMLLAYQHHNAVGRDALDVVLFCIVIAAQTFTLTVSALGLGLAARHAIRRRTRPALPAV